MQIHGKTHLNWHLVDVNTFLDTKVLNNDIERLVEDSNDMSLSIDWSVLLSEIGDESAEEEMLALLLSKLRSCLLVVAVLSDLGDSLRVHHEAGLRS